jgi:hypothetical protein
MTGETIHAFALAPAFRQQGGRRLQPGKPLPRRFAQLAYDLHGQCLHTRDVCQSSLNVKRAASAGIAGCDRADPVFSPLDTEFEIRCSKSLAAKERKEHKDNPFRPLFFAIYAFFRGYTSA